VAVEWEGGGVFLGAEQLNYTLQRSVSVRIILAKCYSANCAFLGGLLFHVHYLLYWMRIATLSAYFQLLADPAFSPLHLTGNPIKWRYMPSRIIRNYALPKSLHVRCV
jgi:hypothetical protein